MRWPAVLDLTSSLYLGMHHPMSALRPWSALTLGKPQALEAPPGMAEIAAQLAALQGAEAALLAPSTLHLFWDLFPALARHRLSIHLDSGAYAIARWGAERAVARGATLSSFAHHDAEAALKSIQRERGGAVPVIVTDGFCPLCARPAPLAEHLGTIERMGGYLVIDDTQALGLLGAAPGPFHPFGSGGGGSLVHQAIASRRAISASSLAKSFGVPLAVLSGNAHLVRHLARTSETAVHSSPPSMASLRAAERALSQNRLHGDERRAHLLMLLRRLRAGLGRAGLAVEGKPFPVQSLTPPEGFDAPGLHRELARRGIRTVLTRDCRGGDARLVAILTAQHRPSDVDRLLETIRRVAAEPPRRRDIARRRRRS